MKVKDFIKLTQDQLISMYGDTTWRFGYMYRNRPVYYNVNELDVIKKQTVYISADAERESNIVCEMTLKEFFKETIFGYAHKLNGVSYEEEVKIL